MLSRIFKKKNKKKVIGFTGIHYNGNSRAVFEWMIKNTDYDCWWIARNKKSYLKAKEKSNKVIFALFIEGLMRLKEIDLLVTTDSALSFFFQNNKPKTIQLWHGVGPKPTFHSQEEYEMFDIWCTASEFSKQRHIKLWHAPENKLRATGFARMDLLYNYLKIPRKTLLSELGIKNCRKTILYAPTFNVGLWPWGNGYKEFEKFCKFCEKEDIALILRPHPFVNIKWKKLKKIVTKHKNIYLLTMSKEPDTMKLLALADILITDNWSSIYTDYLLTNRPIVFLKVNYSYIAKKTGDPEIPQDYIAGETVTNNEEFYEKLNIVCKIGNRFSKEQEKLLKIIHGNVDGKSSERVATIVKELLTK
jgi:CDP-glycerol glycerophosphotransferase